MKPILILTLLAAIVPQGAAQQITAAKEFDAEPDFIFIQEIGMWKTLQSHDLGAFESLLLPDYIEVEKTIQTRAQLMANLNTCTIVGFKLRNHQTRMLSADAAVIVYSGSSEITCGDSHIASSYNATTIWVRRDGKWLVQLHTEIPIKP
ncbi:MAG: nuclear transport factor 2 family protein [Bryobacterales bacterium]|nr:nuclear transport factor 2 family protein [Bryobacterales bacterium]